MSNLQLTSLSDLQQYSRGTLVELPPFAEGQPFVARIKRPSMLALAKAKRIPNSLLSTANELFVDGKVDSDDEEVLESLFTVIEVIADACFVEPTLQEIKEAGVELTDDQYMFIFNYSQQGVKAIEPFRTKREHTGDNISEQDI